MIDLGSSELSARAVHKGHTLWYHMREITKVVMERGRGSAWARCVVAQEPSAKGRESFFGVVKMLRLDCMGAYLDISFCQNSFNLI